MQPRAGEDDELIDTRLVHGESQPVLAIVPEGSRAEETAQGVMIRTPKGHVSFATAWPAPHEGRITPDEWYRA